MAEEEQKLNGEKKDCVFVDEKINDKMIDDKKGKHGFFHHKCKNCEKLKKEAEEYKSGWQRAVADYQNLKKETESRISEWALMSEQQILEEFLPVYDNFKKAFNHDTNTRIYANDANHANLENFENWKRGIEYIMKQFEVVLKAHGIEEIKTVGEVFNPELHEAVGEQIVGIVGTSRDLSVPDLSVQDGIILKEVEAGYTMRGKVIKAAKVIVNKMSNSPNF